MTAKLVLKDSFSFHFTSNISNLYATPLSLFVPLTAPLVAFSSSLYALLYNKARFITLYFGKGTKVFVFNFSLRFSC